jgi:hypothetical protein
LTTSQEASVPSALAAAKSGTLSGSSGTPAPAGLNSGGLAEGFSPGLISSEQSSSMSPARATMGGLLSQILHFSADEHLSILEIATTARGVLQLQDGLPQSLPFSGGMPAGSASGGAPGGSAPSFGGAGFDLGGAFTALLIALLGGKFLWYTRQFLKPNSAFQLLLNEPG